MIVDAVQLLAGLFGELDPTRRALAAVGGIDDLGNLFFFYEIKEFVNYRIDRFLEGLIGRTMSLAGAVALSLMTVWILFKGFRILSGKSQESMMALVMDSLRAALIVTAATTMAAGEFDFGFAIEWMHKDLGFCLQEAERLGLSLPMTRDVDARYQALMARGLGRCDTSVLIRQFD